MRNLFAYFFVFILLVACNGDYVASDTKEMPDFWEAGSKISFDIPEIDSEEWHNLFLEIRNNNEYPYSNIYIIATLKLPQGKRLVDTLEYRMAAPDGTWLGEGLGSLKQSKLWYKENFTFDEKGIYTLELEQAVRNNGEVDGVTRLIGITDIGYSIERAKK